MSFRSVRAGAMAVLLALVVAACGTSPSASSPANKVPAGAALYASATIKPSSSQTRSLEQLIDTVAGKGTAQTLLSKLKTALAKASSNGISYSKDIQPWLGQRIGVALTAIPTTGMTNKQALLTDLLVVAPTGDPAAARKALPTLQKGLPTGITAQVSGNYVLLGGESALRAAALTTGGTSLANEATYKAELRKVGANSLLLVYANAHAIAQAGLKAVGSNSALEQVLAPLLQKVPKGASGMLGASVTSSTIELNLAGSENPTPSGAPADVSNLPSDSWLAIGTPAISTKELLAAVGPISALAKLAASGALTPKSSSSGKSDQSGKADKSGTSGLLGQLAVTAKAKTKAEAKTKTTSKAATPSPLFNGNPALALQKLLPLVQSGLGPMQLSVAGFPNAGLKAGFRMSEPDPASASAAVQGLYALAQFAKLKTSGSSSSFSVTASPTLAVGVGSVGNDVVATLGYPQASTFTNPSLTLAAGNPVYREALAQLPVGSTVPVFVDLTQLSSMVSNDPKLSKTPLAKALTHLRYLIVGYSSGTSRIVLGLR